MPQRDPTDRDLLARASVEPDAFVAFYRRYEPAIVGYLMRRLGDAELAADLTAEVFAAALSAAPRYRATRPNAAGWLFTIAHNKLANSLRQQKVQDRARRRLGIREAIGFSDDELERVVAVANSPTWAADLLAQLPSEQADAVRRHVLEDRSYPEIAAELQTSELVVRKRVSRGLAAIRMNLPEEFSP